MDNKEESFENAFQKELRYEKPANASVSYQEKSIWYLFYWNKANTNTISAFNFEEKGWVEYEY